MGRKRFLAMLVTISLIIAFSLGLTTPGIQAAGPPFHVAVHATRTVGKPFAQVQYILRQLLYRPPGGKLRSAARKTPVYTNYFFRTRTRDKANVQFTDKTSLLLNQQTDIVVRSHVTYLKRGEVAEYLSPGTDHRISTATALVAAIGTRFDVRVTATSTIVIDLHGAVVVSNKKGKVEVKPNQETVVPKGKAPQKPKPVNPGVGTGWTGNIPALIPAENIALAADGGQVVDYTSQLDSDNNEWDATNINDGTLDNGWKSDTGDISGASVTLAFSQNELADISKVIIDPAATHGDTPDKDLKGFEIDVSTVNEPYSLVTDDDFKTVLQGTCMQSATLQSFTLPKAVQATYLRITARSNYGSTDSVAIAELEVIGKPALPTFPGTWRAVTPGDTPLISPQGLALDATGKLYVADSAADDILQLSPAGETLATWGSTGALPGEFNGPTDVVLDAQGNIYVADNGNDRIQKLSPSGQPLAQWGSAGSGPGQFSGPTGIALDAQGNIYVADTENDRIQKLSPSGQPLAQWGNTGSAPGQFNGPSGIALDAQGNIYVADTGNDRIQKLSPEGQPLAQWGTSGVEVGQLDSPYALVLDAHGDVYVTEVGNNRIQKFDPSGKAIAIWGAPGEDAGQLMFPQGITIDMQGNLYVSDSGNGRIEELTPGV